MTRQNAPHGLEYLQRVTMKYLLMLQDVPIVRRFCLTTELLVEPHSGFQNLALTPELLAAVERAGYREPTPIQAAFIPEALTGRDVIGPAQTGTGKTAAFLLPFMNSWREKNEPGPQALVLANDCEKRPQAPRGASESQWGGVHGAYRPMTRRVTRGA